MRSEAFWTDFDANAHAALQSRGPTFAAIFAYLDRFDRPVGIVETGCARQQATPAGAPGSTLLFDNYAAHHPASTVQSVDIDPNATSACRALVSERVTITTGDSVAFLAELARAAPASAWPIDLLYLNSADIDYDNPFPAAWRHMQELAAILPLLHAETLVVVDSAPTVLHGIVRDGGGFTVVGPPRIGGNGKLVAEYAQQVGARVHLHGFQTGWTGLRSAQAPTAGQRSPVRAIVAQTAQGLFAVDAEDAAVGRALREIGSYGLREIDLATGFIAPDDNVLVVGGHVGAIAIPLARRCRHLSVVEANPWTAKLLRCNVLLNDADNIAVHGFAAGERNGTIRFVANTQNSGGSKRYPVHPAPGYFHDNPTIIDVECARLDDRLDRHDFRLVFMDIEGSEYPALLGMKRILAFAECLIVEFLPHHLANVAGIDPETFAAALEPYFTTMFVPGPALRFGRDAFAPALRDMFDRGQASAGLVFSK